jgi:hypothetical protein
MQRGIIYLVQPAELVGTNRFKIGCSSKTDLKRCKNGYKNGTRYVLIMECNDPFILENLIKYSFNYKFKLVAGHEYYEGNEADIRLEFFNIVNNHLISTQVQNVAHQQINNSQAIPNPNPIISEIQITIPKPEEIINSIIQFTNNPSDYISNADIQSKLISKNIVLGKMVLSKHLKSIGAVSIKKSGGQRGYTHIQLINST